MDASLVVKETERDSPGSVDEESLIVVDAAPFHETLRELSHKLDILTRPPEWLEQLQKRLSVLEDSMSGVRCPPLEVDTPLTDEEEGMERRVMKKLTEVIRKDQLSKLDIQARMMNFSIEQERQSKMIEVAPSVRDLEIMNDSWQGKLKSFKRVVKERIDEMQRTLLREQREESARIELTARTRDMERAESISRLEERVGLFEKRIESLVEESREQQKLSTEALVAEVEKGCFTALNEIRQDIEREKRTRMEEGREFVIALSQTQNDLESRTNAVQEMISAHEQKATSATAGVGHEVENVRALIDATAREASAIRNKAENLESRMVDVELIQETVEKKFEEGERHDHSVEERLNRLDKDRIQQGQTLRDLTENLKTETLRALAEVKEEVTDHGSKLEMQANRLTPVEQEAFHIIPSTLSKHADLIQGLDTRSKQSIETQVKWNSKTTNRIENAEKCEQNHALETREELEAHRARFSFLEKSQTNAKNDADADRLRVDEFESTVRGQHERFIATVESLQKVSEARLAEQQNHVSSEIVSLRDQFELQFSMLVDEMSTKVKDSKTPVYLDADDQEIFLKKKAALLAETSLEFEQERCSQKTALSEDDHALLPTGCCETISLVAQQIAEYVALKADLWAVAKHIHGAPEDDDDDNAYGNFDKIEMRRQHLLNRFMMLHATEVKQSGNEEPNLFKQQARNKVRRKIKSALDMALSKFDKVSVTATSRVLSRHLDTTAPKCFTCDRPLLDSACRHLPGRQESVADQQQFSPSVCFRRDPQTTATEKPSTSSTSTSTAKREKKKSIVRAGFRLPCGQLSPDIRKMMEPNVVALSAARSGDDGDADGREPHTMSASKSLPAL